MIEQAIELAGLRTIAIGDPGAPVEQTIELAGLRTIAIGDPGAPLAPKRTA